MREESVRSAAILAALFARGYRRPGESEIRRDIIRDELDFLIMNFLMRDF